MKNLKFYFGLLLAFIITNVAAQTTLPASEKSRKYTLYAGIGPNIYFNNLVLAKNYVNVNNYSIAGKFMWEPEHHLSLGIESGYYCLYTVDFGELSDLDISNYAIPIQLTISMKLLKTFYFSFSSGPTILVNKVITANGGRVDASTMSLGDFSCALGYKHRINQHFTMSAETKFFFASKLDDKNIALLFLLGYTF